MLMPASQVCSHTLQEKKVQSRTVQGRNILVDCTTTTMQKYLIHLTVVHATYSCRSDCTANTRWHISVTFIHAVQLFCAGDHHYIADASVTK